MDIEKFVIEMGILGVFVLLVGMILSKYPPTERFLLLKRKLTFNDISNLQPFKFIINFFVGDKNVWTYKILEKTIKTTDSTLSVHSLFFLKLVFPVVFVILYSLISFTNTSVLRDKIIGDFSYVKEDLFADSTSNNPSYNKELYAAITKRVGDSTLRTLSSEKRIEVVRKILPELIGSNNTENLRDRATKFNKTYISINALNILGNKLILFMILPFFVPEIYLFFRRIMRSGKYEKEVIKLENVFE